MSTSSKLGDKLTANAAQPPKNERVKCCEVNEDAMYGAEFIPGNKPGLVMPYHHLGFVDIGPHLKGEKTLRIVYWTHIVLLEGRNLDKISTALRRGRDLIVRAVDPQFEELYQEDEVFVAKMTIELRAAKGEAKPGHLTAAGDADLGGEDEGPSIDLGPREPRGR